MPTPHLSVDLAVVRARFAELRAALPVTRVFYAVKANPAEEVVAALVDAGAGFDVASPGEVELVLRHGADPAALCYANPVRKPSDVASATAAGVRLFVTDSPEDLVTVAEHAPGADVLVRLAVDDTGAATPFGGKFGCSQLSAVQLLHDAVKVGVRAVGLAFHVGSQQLRPAAFATAIGIASKVAGAAGLPRLPMLDIGGGFPVRYRDPVPDIGEYAAAIRAALGAHFPVDPPELAVEPGRFLVAEAGTVRAQVVRATHRHDGRRWVYLDVGRYGGLAETEGEAITYPIRTAHDGDLFGPAVLAGPSCDGDDVLYREIQLPVALRAGDTVELLAAGAYSASYSSVAFNGIPPLAVHCVDSEADSNVSTYLPPAAGVRRPFTGRHVLAELTDVDPGLLDDERAVRAALAEALVEAGATVLRTVGHRFEPTGLTVVAVLAESHASVHTWPERGSAFVDVFTCGLAADPELAVALLADRLGAGQIHRRTVERGETHQALQVSEPLSPGLRRLWDVDEVLWAGRTAFQNVVIGRTAHGVTLFCDDERQSSETSQLVYHEALLVPALLLAEQLRDVLVIGSSEGVVSQLSLAAGARRVDHIDIDTECVKACARHLPYGYTEVELAAAERGDGPVTVRYTDGWEYLRTTGHRYDVVVIDLPDERPDDAEAQHNRLYRVEFLRLASAVLAPGGVLGGQVGCSTLWRNDTLRTSLARYREVFGTVVHYGSDEHEWSFLTGSPTPIADPVRRMTERLPTLAYRPESIDGDAIRRGAVLPISLRSSPRAGSRRASGSRERG